jgi:exodeoxyribonuclease X
VHCLGTQLNLREDGTIANQQSTLVRPGIPVPPESSAVHHLIDEDLAGAPPLMELFKDADAYVAHNADFERSFLGPLLGDATWVCTYKAALRIWPTCRRTTTRR